MSKNWQNWNFSFIALIYSTLHKSCQKSDKCVFSPFCTINLYSSCFPVFLISFLSMPIFFTFCFFLLYIRPTRSEIGSWKFDFFCLFAKKSAFWVIFEVISRDFLCWIKGNMACLPYLSTLIPLFAQHPMCQKKKGWVEGKVCSYKFSIT